VLGNYAQLIGLPVLRAQGKHWLAIARHLQRGQPKMLNAVQGSIYKAASALTPLP
jgi:hypothetical protein